MLRMSVLPKYICGPNYYPYLIRIYGFYFTNYKHNCHRVPPLQVFAGCPAPELTAHFACLPRMDGKI